MSEKIFGLMAFVFFTLIMGLVVSGVVLVETATAIALCIVYSLALFYVAMPTGIKKFLTNPFIGYPLDLLISLSIPYTIGFTLAGVLGSVITGIVITLAMKFEYLRLRRKFSWQQRSSPSSPGSSDWVPDAWRSTHCQGETRRASPRRTSRRFARS